MDNLPTILNALPAPTTPGSLFPDGFLEEHNIIIKQEDDLVLFKYSFIDSVWTDVSKQCRGTILRYERQDDGRILWEYASRPFSKFFNLQEAECSVSEKEWEHIATQSLFSFEEKADGSFIQVWWDRKKEKWRASTSGMITPIEAYDSIFTFDQLFWNLVGPKREELLAHMVPGVTYMFELCTAANRVVTRYPKSRLYFLGNSYVEPERNIPDMHSYVEQAGAPFHLPVTVPATSLIVTGEDGRPRAPTLEELPSVVEQWTSTTENLGEVPEGMVMRFLGVPVAKIKTPTYLAMHRLKGDNPRETIKNIISLFFEGKLDDYMPLLSDDSKLLIETLEKEWRAFHHEMNSHIIFLSQQTFDSRKAYATAVKERVKEGWLQAFLFRNMEEVCSTGSVDTLGPSFQQYVHTNYTKHPWLSEHIQNQAKSHE